MTQILNELDPEALMAAAEAETQLSDYGDLDFVEPLTRWLESACTEGRLSPAGLAGTRANVQRLLVNRLRFQADLIRHPEILDEEVVAPIVIIGMPRTGTTKLQRAMSTDPAVQPLHMWRILTPPPIPGSAGTDPDPRIALAEGFVEQLLRVSPGWMAGHPTIATEPDEEAFMMEMTFETVVNSYRARVPSYLAWWRGAPRGRPYGYLRGLLQYLQWQDGGGRGRPWVLKSPAHLGNLDLLVETFPGVTVVHCHRDPIVAVPSTARLIEALRYISSDDVDLAELGQEVLADFGVEMARNLRQREELGDTLDIVDLHYEDILTDLEGAIRTVYERRGQPRTEEAVRRVKGWEAEHAQHRWGRHEYSLERYHLTGDEVARAFSPYREQFTPGGCRPIGPLERKDGS